ncbi:phosphoprotein [Wufeng Rhinolophus pearsonii paramyxovirus 1]|uniref:Phosphoprotein n=1 Tax=Wufeng Rhinolophus pearsonii paramyxovirus 1 TaxID=2877502 RepID=A0AAE8XR93_9MONO|nr:phosphoprotein [Wufeng Rhinolophus pearsonii paramyxovirus 1]
MSGFDPSDLAASVENGLQIAGFIQKNREKINRTYGRSAITGPTTKERAVAWEEFYKDLLEENGGHDICESSEKGTEEKNGSTGDIRLGQHQPSVPVHGSDTDKSNANRDNESRHVEGTDGQSKERRSRSNSPNVHAAGVRNPNTKRTDESQGSPGFLENPSDASGRMDDEEHKSIRRDSKRSGLNESSSESLSVEELDSVLNEESVSGPKRLKSYNKLKELSKKPNKISTPIKKGTEERSLSMYSMEEPLYENGATRDVHRSEKYQPEIDADVESVETGVASASTISTPLSEKPEVTLHQKIDQIILTQSKILERLTYINEIKEEITNIKKAMHNFGLTLSTIEGYINSLMIIIPKSGIPTDDEDKQINPDLKMVIGRDRTRGLQDFNNRQASVKNDKFGEDLFQMQELDEAALLPPIDKTKNHAARFVPTNDGISIYVVEELVKRKVKDENIKKRMIDLIRKNAGSMDVNDIYNEVKNALESMYS